MLEGCLVKVKARTFGELAALLALSQVHSLTCIIRQRVIGLSVRTLISLRLSPPRGDTHLLQVVEGVALAERRARRLELVETQQTFAV